MPPADPDMRRFPSPRRRPPEVPHRRPHTIGRTLIALAGAALLLAGCGDETASDEPSRDRAEPLPEPSFPALSDADLTGVPTADWPTVGGGLANQRYSGLDQVDRSNVSSLVPVWLHSTGIEGALETTPLVVGNTLYATTAGGRVIALDAATGDELWSHDPDPGPVTLCCGPTNRGVSSYGGMIYVASLDARLLALDARSGDPVWEARLADPTEGYSAIMAPVAADGRVFVGVSGERYGIRGFLAAFDAGSGEELWRWHAIPTDSAGWWGPWSETDPFGTSLNRDIADERADSLDTRWSWMVGGGGIATTPAYDPETGRLFVNVEGPAPVVDGSLRPGDNLYTGSIVALDAATGERVWHAQYLPHDVWGLSGGSPPFLFDRGGERYVAFAGRTGWMYVFDADTGEPILRSDNFVPQEGLFARPPTDGGVRMAPGANGGNAGAGVAYDPTTGIAYVGGIHQPMIYTADPEPYARGRLWLGGAMRFAPGEEQWGTVTAIDLQDGSILWQRRTPDPVHAPALATAGGLLFLGQGSGTLDAFDARTGELLWRFNLGAGVHGGPVTYRVAGTQYVVAPAGGSFHFETRPGDELVAFALINYVRQKSISSYPKTGYDHHGPRLPGQGAIRQVDPDTARAEPADTAPPDVDSAGRRR